MGLLEEAIREHLELQRRSGADPNRIARAEQEALEPLVPGQTPAWAEGPMLFDHEHASPESTAAGVIDTSAPASEVSAAASDVSAAEATPLLVEQETAELDMSTVLGELATWQDPLLPSGPGVPEFGPVRARRIVPDAAARMREDGDFEWEVPERSSQPPASPAPARQGSFLFE